MKPITQRELFDNFAAVMAAVEGGRTYHVTRNGVEVAELRPPACGRRSAEELVRRHRRLPRGDAAQARREADEFFGEDRAGDGGDERVKPGDG